ncbi:MAG: hypothetical protein ACJ75F_03895 [Flavisolibacter sp.]
MQSRLLILFFFITVFHSKIFAQTVKLLSFQHTQRWIAENNFPAYTNEKNVQELIFASTSSSLKNKLKATQVDLPDKIEYDYIAGFGKAKIKEPKAAGAANDFQVSILSFITRATTGFAVEWHMEARVVQNGQTIFSNKTEHELEYYNVSGYMRPVAWMNQDEFVARMDTMVNEVLGNIAPLPGKIVIGSYKQMEDEVVRSMNSPAKYLLKTKGSFLDAGNYIMSLQSETDTVATVNYKDGWDASSTPLINSSELAAGFFKSVTGIDMAYNYKSRERRYGKLLYEDGRKIKLRMEWSEEKQMYTDNTTGIKYYRSPMLAELYEEDEVIGYFAFEKKAPGPGKHKGITTVSAATYQLDGNIRNLPVHVDYDPATGYLVLNHNDRVMITIVMQNMNPDSRSLGGQKLSKNKVFITEGTSIKPSFKDSEWYYFYYDPAISPKEMQQYIDAILCLFFGIGKEKT